MNYGNYTYNKITIFVCFINFVRTFRFSIVQIYFGIVGVFCVMNRYFKCVYRIRCIFLYIGRDFEGIFIDCLEKCPEV